MEIGKPKSPTIHLEHLMSLELGRLTLNGRGISPCKSWVHVRGYPKYIDVWATN